MTELFDYEEMEKRFQKEDENTQAEFNKELRSHLKGKTIKDVSGYYSLVFLGPKEIKITFTDNTGLRFTDEGFEYFDNNPTPKYIQAFDPAIQRWVKIDAERDQIVATKSDSKPYNNIPTESRKAKRKYIAVQSHIKKDGTHVRAHLRRIKKE